MTFAKREGKKRETQYAERSREKERKERNGKREEERKGRKRRQPQPTANPLFSGSHYTATCTDGKTYVGNQQKQP